MRKNTYLIVGGFLSCFAALLHIGIIIGGPNWYRFFGAGETMATLAATGSPYPTLITSGIAAVLFAWGLYAFSGAHLIRRLPFLKPVLAIVSVIYLGRGLAIVPAYLLAPNQIDAFAIWSSLICLVYGYCYAIGTKNIWRDTVF